MGNPLEVVFVLLFATYGIAAGSISSESDDIFLFIDDITVASIHEQGKFLNLDCKLGIHGSVVAKTTVHPY
eukprot:713419-Amorphochlora_amoeboformis.AAC.1